MIIKCLNIRNMDEDKYRILWNAVPEEKKRSAEKFYHKEDAYRSICAEILIRFCIHETTGTLSFFDMKRNAYGKPYISGIEDFCFNLSHAGEWVVIAYGRKEVGIDVEMMRTDMTGIVNSCYGKSEKAYIFSAEGREKDERAIEIWTMKESYVKYRGMGLSLEFDSFDVKEMEKNGIPCFFRTWRLPGGYYMTVCGEETDIRIEQASPEDLIRFAGLKDDKELILE